ncbi:MAG: hypothetical protein Q9187_001460 [Circinaria calcarea]
MSAPEAIKEAQRSEAETDRKSEEAAAANSVPKETYIASCHCNANAYTISMPKVSEVAECNCSACRKEGALWAPAEGTVTTPRSWIRGGEDHLTEYECFKKEDGSAKFMARAFRDVGVYALEIKRYANFIPAHRKSWEFIINSDYACRNDDINTPPAYIQKKAEGVEFDSVDEGMKVYDGSCHCGAVTWKLKSKPLEDLVVVECNCSFCKRNGDLYVYPSAGFVLVSPESAQHITQYQFGKKRLLHDFCKLCGVSTMERMTKEPGEAHGVNVRCLDGVDIWQLKKKALDGFAKYEPQYKVE